jgi:hypothetical protein
MKHTMKQSRRTNKSLALFIAAGAIPAAAWAHPGHGLGSGSHWHAVDAWGWALALVVAGALALWLGRGK